MNTIEQTVTSMAQAARRAARSIGCCSASQKNAALERMADGILQGADVIQEANRKDLDAARALYDADEHINERRFALEFESAMTMRATQRKMISEAVTITLVG